MGKRIVAMMMATTILIGCSPRAPRLDTFQGQGMKVGQVGVRVADDALEDRREEVFTKAEGSKRLREDVITLLTAHGLFDTSSKVALNIEITSFRMRNGATRFFTGMMSGADHLSGQMNVEQGGATIIKKPIEVSGGNGNPFNISSDSRSAGLINSFSKLVVHALRNDSIIPQANAAVQASAPTTQAPSSAEQKGPPPSRKAAASGSCTVDQVISMKQSGLADSQIRSACK